MKQQTKLRDKFLRDMEIKGFSSKTINLYLRHVLRFVKYYNKGPENLNSEDIKNYLYYMKVEKVRSQGYLSQCYSALKFLYETTMKQDWDSFKIPKSKKTKKLPTVLKKEEIQKMLSTIKNIKHRAILELIYSGGLRVSEVVNLKVKDIDGKDLRMFIKDGKGKKDRYTILSEKALKTLRSYYSLYHPTNWLFPGQDMITPLSVRTVQKVFDTAKKTSRINISASVHSLRHSFATHLIEAGIDIYYIQRLLGHASIKTTSIYINVSSKDALKVKSPLDIIYKKEDNFWE